MKKFLSMLLAVLMLVSMIPVMSLAEDDEQTDNQVDTLANGQTDSFDSHTFNHIDVRIQGATFTLKHNIKDAQGNVITTTTESVTASVTAVHSVTIKYSESKQTKYDSGFTKSGTYEFRKLNGVAIKGSDITDSTKAIIVVDLVDAKGKNYENVTFTLNKAKIVEAAEHCDGYSNGKYDGLDFELSGAINEDDVKVTVESTNINFTVTKNLDGALCTTPDLFEFELWQGDQQIATAKNDANGKASFTVSYDNLTSFEDITYTIKEKIDENDDTYVYDNTQYTITIGFREAEEVNGKYVRYPYVKSGDIQNLVFNNSTVTPTPTATTSTEPDPTPEATTSTEPDPTPAATTSTEPDPTPEATTSTEPDPTPSAETKYEQVDFTIEKKVVDAYGNAKVVPEDTTFTFQITNFADLTAKDFKFKFKQDDITDGTFTLTVSAGASSASGTLTVFVPEGADRTWGYIKEVGSNHVSQYMWKYDESTMYFLIDPDMGENAAGTVIESFTPWYGNTKLTFTNVWDTSATPTPAPTPSAETEYVYKDFTIVKNVVDEDNNPVALTEDTTFTFKIARFEIYDDGYDAEDYDYTFQFNGQTLGADRTFTLKVEAGKTSAQGTLTIGIPSDAKDEYGWLAILGYIQEVSSEPAANWTLDENKQWFLVGYDLSTATQIKNNLSPMESDYWDDNSTTLTFTNKYEDTYDPNETLNVMIPVQKVVEMTGKYLPSTDTAFNFRLTLSNKEMGTDQIVVKLGDAVVNGGEFSLTVKAGDTTASGSLYISGPRSQMAFLTGILEEIAPENTGKWTYDTKKYTFVLNENGGFEFFGYPNDDGELIPASNAAFTNQFLENVPRTNLTVKKVWQDKGYEKKRPESITVELYYYQKDSDGKDTKTKVLYKVNGEAMTAVLSEGDDWTYTFENLDARFTWTVDEVKTPTGYTRKVTLSSDKKTVTVTNTYGAQPKTGFDGLPLILCMVAVMLAGGVALVVINRKKSSRKGN